MKSFWGYRFRSPYSLQWKMINYFLQKLKIDTCFSFTNKVYYLLISQIICIGTYFIAWCFFSVYDMAVDTLFLCFRKYDSYYYHWIFINLNIHQFNVIITYSSGHETYYIAKLWKPLEVAVSWENFPNSLHLGHDSKHSYWQHE